MVMSNAGWGMRNSHALLVWLLIAVIYTKVSGIFIKVENAGGRGLNGHGKTTIKIKLKKETACIFKTAMYTFENIFNRKNCKWMYIKCIYLNINMYIKEWALAGVAQWTGCRPGNRKVTCSIPGQGTCLGWGPGPQLGVCERQPIDVSLTHQCFFLFLSPFPL